MKKKVKHKVEKVFVFLKEPHFCSKSPYAEILYTKKGRTVLKCCGCGETFVSNGDLISTEKKAQDLTIQTNPESVEQAYLGDICVLFHRFEEKENINRSRYGDWIISAMTSQTVTLTCKEIGKTKTISKESYKFYVLLNVSNLDRKRTKNKKLIEQLKVGNQIILRNTGERSRLVWHVVKIYNKKIFIQRHYKKQVLNVLFHDFDILPPAKQPIGREKKLESKSVSIDPVVEFPNRTVNDRKKKKIKQALKPERSRVKIHPINYPSVAEAFNKETLTFKLQLVNSSGNHATYGHRIIDLSIKLPFKDPKTKKIKILELKAHQCIDCNKIFDFNSSFNEQIQRVGLKINDFKIQFAIQDETGDFHIEKDPFSSFRSESFLHTLGYHVGVNAESDEQRQELLKKILDSRAMSISEIKSILNQDLRLFSKRKEYHLATEQWKADIQFLNGLIKNNS